MTNKFNFDGKIDFNDVDLTSPKIVVETLIKDLSEATNNIVEGKIEEYNGPIHSYTDNGINAIKVALGNVSRHVNIQEKLGEISNSNEKYEFYLKTPLYEHYKFRVCFIKYGVGNYPVEVVLEQGIVNDMYGYDEDYVLECNNKSEFEELIINILNSDRIIKIMQELVRIHQIYFEKAQKEQEAIEKQIAENKKRPTENGCS
jgi:hypothetical protein